MTVLSLEDLALKAGVPAERLAEWSKAKLLKPDGFSDDKAPSSPPAASTAWPTSGVWPTSATGPTRSPRSSRRSASPGKTAAGRRAPRRPSS
ncbi:MAG: hypothetical protein M0C28_25100 [Candidatus Moduliflexus flocculans]|nr:hypothetical protein [Candidatus Moduliflexus flocculans]